MRFACHALCLLRGAKQAVYGVSASVAFVLVMVALLMTVEVSMTHHLVMP